MTLDLQSGGLTHGGNDVALPFQYSSVAIEDSLTELAFFSQLANRDPQTGDLTLEANRFPENTETFQTVLVNPNGKDAYAVVNGPTNPDGSTFPVFLHVFQRQADGNFTLFRQSTIGQSEDFSFDDFVFLGVIESGGADYMVVTERRAGHPGTFPHLMLWPLSAAGDQVGDSLQVIGGDDDRITVGWSGNLLVSQAQLDFSPASPYIQAVTRVANGSTQKIASCDDKAPVPCPSFQSIAVAPNQRYAFGIAVTSTSVQLLKITWNESEGTMAFSDTGIIPNNKSASDSIFIDPSGEYLLEAAFSDKQVRVFRIDIGSGALTEVAGSPFTTPGTIMDLAFLPQP